MYIDYQDYLEFGGVLDTTVFEKNIYRVNGIIAAETHNRLDKMAVIPRSVKALCRELIDIFNERKYKEISSQSVGNISESYVRLTDDEFNKKIMSMIEDYLLAEVDDNGTPLLYRGGTK